jgi:hypothetical protein
VALRDAAGRERARARRRRRAHGRRRRGSRDAAVVDGAGDRSREARELLFMALDGGLLATIAAGSGDEIFRRQ